MDNQETIVTETENTGTETAKTYTQEEVMALLQSETDKRVTAALKTQEKKFAKQLSLSKLDDDAREKAEKDALIEELREQLKERDIANNKSEIKSVLGARGLNAEFADLIIIGEDAEDNQQRIDTFDRLFKKAVTAEVERRLAAAGGTPKGNVTQSSGELTPEAFAKLPLREQNALYKTNPELYKKLTK